MVGFVRKGDHSKYDANTQRPAGGVTAAWDHSEFAERQPKCCSGAHNEQDLGKTSRNTKGWSQGKESSLQMIGLWGKGCEIGSRKKQVGEGRNRKVSKGWGTKRREGLWVKTPGVESLEGKRK